MAERRMLAKSIIESDAFSCMPLESQMLYIRLNMAADDDGFVSNPRSVMRMCGASEDSMKLLVAKKFVLTFDVGDNFIFLIKHWKIHNYIRTDRYRASTFKNLLREVYYDENKAYSMTPGEGKTPVLQAADGIPPVGGGCTGGMTRSLPSGIPSGMPAGIPDDVPSGSRAGDNSPTDGIPNDNQPGGNRSTQDRLGKREASVRERGGNNNTLSSQLSAGKRGSGGENQAHTDFPQPIVDNPVEKPDSPEHLEKVRVWRKRIELVKKMGHPTDSMYNLAFAQDGISREEIDSFPADGDEPS